MCCIFLCASIGRTVKSIKTIFVVNFVVFVPLLSIWFEFEWHSCHGTRQSCSVSVRGLSAQNFQWMCKFILELWVRALAVVAVVCTWWPLVGFCLKSCQNRKNCPSGVWECGGHEFHSTIYAAILPAMLMCACCEEAGRDNHQVSCDVASTNLCVAQCCMSLYCIGLCMGLGKIVCILQALFCDPQRLCSAMNYKFDMQRCIFCLRPFASSKLQVNIMWT